MYVEKNDIDIEYIENVIKNLKQDIIEKQILVDELESEI